MTSTPGASAPASRQLGVLELGHGGGSPPALGCLTLPGCLASSFVNTQRLSSPWRAPRRSQRFQVAIARIAARLRDSFNQQHLLYTLNRAPQGHTRKF